MTAIATDRALAGWKRILACLLVTAGALGMSGCSLMRVGYNYADNVALYMARDHFDPGTAQYEELKTRVARLHQWHRGKELPEYETLLRSAMARIEKGVAPLDVSWAYSALRVRFRDVAVRVSEEVAPVLATLSTAQIAHLEHKLAEANEKYAREYLNGNPSKQHRARTERTKDRFEDWVGGLNREQEAMIEQFVAANDRYTRLRFEDRQRWQRDAVALIKRHRRAEDLAVHLGRLFADPDATRTEEFLGETKRWEASLALLMVQMNRTLTREQRARAIERLGRYADEFKALAAAPRKG